MNDRPDPDLRRKIAMPQDRRLLVPIAERPRRFRLLFSWLFALRRQPCPHCLRRAGRNLAGWGAWIGRLRPHALLYQCRSCGGLMRYARRATGQEYWERAEDRLGPS